jgi:NADPH-dependent 2,4-dienoyl-CoA reductase/sulfur reductase-like enzyme
MTRSAFSRPMIQRAARRMASHAHLMDTTGPLDRRDREMTERPSSHLKVVIAGGGFAGLYAAKRVSGEAGDVALVDRKKHHTFQPLLYQVALGSIVAR